MTVFEYASGLISIVVGLAVARVLGGIGTFMATSQRSAVDWVGAFWCAAILAPWVLAASFLYLVASLASSWSP